MNWQAWILKLLSVDSRFRGNKLSRGNDVSCGNELSQRGFSLIEVLVGTSLASLVLMGTVKVSQVHRQMSEVSKLAPLEQELKSAMVRILGESNECRRNLNPARLQGDKAHEGVGQLLSLVRYNRPGKSDDVPLLSRGKLFNNKIELIKMELMREAQDKDSDPKARITKRNFVIYYKKTGLGPAQTLENKPCTAEDTTFCYFAQCSLNYRLENKKTSPGVLDCEALNCLTEASGHPECYTVDYESADGSKPVAGKGRTLVGCGGTSGIETGATTALGFGAGAFNTQGAYNTFLGSYAGEQNTKGRKNMFLGARAGGRHLTFTTKDGKTKSGELNTFAGSGAGLGLPTITETGTLNTFLGSNAGRFSAKDSTKDDPGLGKTFIGFSAGRGMRGIPKTNSKDGEKSYVDYVNNKSDNLFLGVQAGMVNLEDGNTFIGNYAAGGHPLDRHGKINGQKPKGQVHYLPTHVAGSVFIGTCSGYNAHSTQKDGGTKHNVFLGPFTGFNNNTMFFEVNGKKFPSCIAQPQQTSTAQDKDASETTSSEKYPDPTKHFAGGSNIFIGQRAGTGDLTTGDRNVFMGTKAGYNNSEGAENTFIGGEAGLNNTTAHWNTFVGHQAGYYIKGGKFDQNFKSSAKARHNHFLGWQSGMGCTRQEEGECKDGGATGWKNVFIGSRAGYQNTTGTHNVFIGNRAGRKNQGGHFNVAVGSSAFRGGDADKTGASFNTFFGWGAGADTKRKNESQSAPHYYENLNNKKPGYLNTSVGYRAVGPVSGSGNVFIGKDAGVFQNTGHGNIYIGSHGSLKGRHHPPRCVSEGECRVNSVGPHQTVKDKSAGITRDGSYQLNIGNLLIGKMPESAHKSPHLKPSGPPGLIVNGSLCVSKTISQHTECQNSISNEIENSLPGKIAQVENLLKEWQSLRMQLASSESSLALAQRRYEDRKRQQKYMLEERARQKKEQEEALLKQKPAFQENKNAKPGEKPSPFFPPQVR